MKLYPNQDVQGADLVPGDLLRSKRGVHSIIISVGENIALLTEAGRCYNISRDQAATGTRLGHIDLAGLRFDYVFSECFVSDLVKNYQAEITKRTLVEQLKDIPADVLEAALEARRNQNLIHSRPAKA